MSVTSPKQPEGKDAARARIKSKDDRGEYLGVGPLGEAAESSHSDFDEQGREGTEEEEKDPRQGCDEEWASHSIECPGWDGRKHYAFFVYPRPKPPTRSS